MKGFLSIFKRELAQLFSSPKLLFLVFGVPIMLFVYYAVLLNEGVAKDLPVTLLDQDKSSLSRQFARMIDATPTMQIAYEVNDLKEGENTIKRVESYALIVIPKDFAKDVQKNAQTELLCYYNGQFLLPGGLILRDFQVVAGMLAAGARVTTLEQGGLMPQQALGMVTSVNVDSHVLYNPFTSYEYYLTVGLMPMAFQIMIVVVTIFAVGGDLKYQRGRQLLEETGGSVIAVVFGKILPYTLIFFVIGVFMNAMLFGEIAVPLKGSLFGVNLFFLLYIIVSQAMAFFIASIMPSFRAALSIGGSYAALAFSFAGYTFPPEGMSTFIQGFSYLFPFHAYMRFNVNYAIRGITYNSDQLNYLIAMAVFIALGILVLPLYYSKLKKGGYGSYE